jgi:hypothetical protein
LRGVSGTAATNAWFSMAAQIKKYVNKISKDV